MSDILFTILLHCSTILLSILFIIVLFVINPPNLKVPNIISIRPDIPRVILTSTVYIQLLDGFRDHRI